MTSQAFAASASQPIIDPELDAALIALGDDISPEHDQARFNLYLEAIDRARASNNPFPDLPHAISDACDRVVRLNALSAEGYKDLFVPQEVTMAQLRKITEQSLANGNRRTAIEALLGMQAIRNGDVYEMLNIGLGRR